MELIYPARKLRDDDELFFYVEKFDYQQRRVLLDFYDSIEFNSFNQISAFDYDWEKRPTMVEILNYNGRRLRENVVYGIQISRIIQLIGLFQVVEDSFLIGFRIVLTENDDELVTKSKAFNSFEDSFRNFFKSDALPEVKFKSGQIERVIVRKVGQGSWNELISNGECKFVFDAGTIYTTSRSDLIAGLDKRNSEYQASKPILILSHWDVDHYHYLLAMDDDTIKAFQLFIYRQGPPNLTARKVVGRFSILNPSAPVSISTVDPYPKKSSTRLQSSNLTSDGGLIFFNAFRNRSRNKSGLGLALRKLNKSVIFSGDYDYSQISDYMLPLLRYKSENFFIVPHHGGKAGKFAFNAHALLEPREAIVSVGRNPYGHPIDHYIDSLRKKGFSVIRTDIKGTHEILL